MRNLRYRLGVATALVVLWGFCHAARAGEAPPPAFPDKPPTVMVSPLAGQVVVDGHFKESAWQDCVEVRDASCLTTGLPGTNGVSFRVGHTAEKLYMAIECPSRTSKPLAKVREHDGAVYTDDCIELYLQPDLAKPDYFQFVANALGTQYEGRGTDKTWNGEWEAAVSTSGGSWRLEIGIPFATLGIQPKPEAELGFNIIRDDKSSGGEPISWCGAYHTPDSWGRLTLGAKAFGLSGLTLQRTKDLGVSITGDLRNPGADPAKAAMVMSLRTPRESQTPGSAGEAKGASTLPMTVTTAVNAVTMSEKVAAAVAVSANGEWLYISPSRQYKVAALASQSMGEKAILENDAVRLEFDASSGDLVSMVHKPSGLELRPRREPSAVFTLESVPYVANSVLFPADRIQTLTPDATTLRECRVDGRTLRQKHVFPCGLEVLVTVELPEKSEVARWQIALDNKPTWHPSQAMIVYRTLFPRLTGLRTDEKPENMKLAIPQICGMLVPDPVANLAKMPAYSMGVEPAKGGAEYKAGRYAPGWASMTWEDLSGPRAGIYLASHDVKPVIATCPESASDQANKEIELSIRRMTITYPGEAFKPAVCSVGVHGPEGWHWSADRYREWFYATVKVRQTPKWLRESSGWLVGGGGGGANFLWEDFPRQIRLGKPYGMAYVQKWQAITGDDVCEGGGRSIDYANFPVPNPYCGSFEKFEAVMKEVHALGGRVGLYKNLPKSDAILGKFVRMPRYLQKIPKGTPLPDDNPFAGGWADSTQMAAGGGFSTVSAPFNNHIDGTWWMCTAAKPWMDFTYDWAVRWNREYKLDTIYLDSCAPAGMNACFNPRHGMNGALGRPHDQAQHTVDFCRRLAEGTDPDYGILQEFVWDRVMEHNTHSLGSFMWCGNGNAAFSEPAIIRYVHSRFPLFVGPSSVPMPSVLGGAMPAPNIPEYFTFAYLYGAYLSHWGADECLAPDYPPELMTPENKELKDIFSLRHAVHQDLNNDDFRDIVGLGELPARVFSRVFVRQDRSAALLTLIDVREKRDGFTLPLDLKAHGLGRATGAEIVRGSVTSPLPAPVMKGTVAEVAIPADAFKFAAVRIFTK